MSDASNDRLVRLEEQILFLGHDLQELDGVVREIRMTLDGLIAHVKQIETAVHSMAEAEVEVEPAATEPE